MHCNSITKATVLFSVLFLILINKFLELDVNKNIILFVAAIVVFRFWYFYLLTTKIHDTEHDTKTNLNYIIET